MNRFTAPIIVLLCCATAGGNPLPHKSEARLWLPDLVSTKHSEVRITFSPDGKRMLWGAIGWADGVGGWDIYESRRTSDGWSKPVSASFNSAANDFDPSFAPDGSGVYFFSNRAGGFGKDDLYFAAFDEKAGSYATAENLGAGVNGDGDEWAPAVSPDGARLLFATDGRGGKGKHDLFIARRVGGEWRDPQSVEVLNSREEDFDATFLEDGQSIIFSRGDLQGKVDLFLARFVDGKLEPGVRLGDAINPKEPKAWAFGPSISPHDSGALYFTSQRSEQRGRADIYRIEYTLQVTD